MYGRHQREDASVLAAGEKNGGEPMKVAAKDNYDRNLDTQKHLERIQQKQEDHVQKAEMELEATKELYRGRRQEVEKDQGDTLQKLRLEKDLEIVEESDRKTQKLEELRKSVEESQKIVSAEKEQLTTHHHENLADLDSVQDNNIQQKMTETYDIARKLKVKSQANIQTLEGKTHQEINKQASTANAKIMGNQRIYDHKVENMQKAQKSTISDSEFVQVRTVAKMEMEQLKEKQQLDYQHKYELGERGKVYTKDFTAQEKKHQEEMQQAQKAFEEKYKTLVESHQNVLQNVQVRLENELNSTISEHSRYRSSKEDKISDPFYQVSKVQAQVQDLEKEYLVQIPVPEYERESVHLTAKDRELSIAISRRFGDDIKTSTGDIYRSKKSESFSRIIPVKDIVDPAKVTQKYEDGILSFKIAKK